MEFLKKYQVEKAEDGAELTLYVSDFDTEFSTELGKELTLSRQDEISRYAQQRFPNMKIKTIKVIAGGILVSMFSLRKILQPKQKVLIDEPVQTVLLPLTYTVKDGDSLHIIAKKFNLTTNELKEYNKLSSDATEVGQIFHIPLTKYSVTEGDTLSSIAKKYGTTVDRMKQLNNLTTDITYLGQALHVPIASVTVKTPIHISEKRN
jgi:peptidoglycan DL-endopeptidase LytF